MFFDVLTTAHRWEAGQCPKQQSPGRAVPRQETLSSCATVFDPALHTRNHSLNVNWNYQS